MFIVKQFIAKTFFVADGLYSEKQTSVPPDVAGRHVL